jgi:hypothetical protein
VAEAPWLIILLNSRRNLLACATSPDAAQASRRFHGKDAKRAPPGRNARAGRGALAAQ